MNPQYRLIPLTLLLMAAALVGCSGAIGGEVITNAVDDPVVVRELQYVDDQREGPLYTVSMTVPEDWVGQFETATQDNRISFDFVEDTDEEDVIVRRNTIFTIEALSSDQYWNQIGGYPGDFNNLLFTADTYFVYHLPIDAYYSGLSDEQFQAFAEVVPSIAQTLSAERVD